MHINNFEGQSLKYSIFLSQTMSTVLVVTAGPALTYSVSFVIAAYEKIQENNSPKCGLMKN